MKGEKALVNFTDIKSLILESFAQLINRNTMTRAERILIVLVLILPISAVIERSIIDLNIILIGIIFLVLFFKTENPISNVPNWFWGALFFVFCGLCSAAVNPDSLNATLEILIWLRFPILALCFSIIFAQNTLLRKWFIALTIATVIFMAVVSFLEISFRYEEWSNAGQHGARLKWPYGDTVVGSYYGKFCLAAIVLAPWAFTKITLKHQVMLYVALCILVFLSGERINFLISICSSGLALVFSNRISVTKLTLGFLSLVAAIIVLFEANEFLYFKWTLFVNQIWNISNSGYAELWRTGIYIGNTNEWLGSGPANFRNLCPIISDNATILLRCDNHPHNYYVQLYAETGLLGMFSGTLMLMLIIFSANLRRLFDKNHAPAWIIPLAFFFPLQSTSDFFGQWMNAFMWTSIGLALSFSSSGPTLKSD